MVGLAKSSSSGLSVSRPDLFRTVSAAGAASLLGNGGTHYLVELWKTDQYDKISVHTHQGLQFLENFSQFIKDRSSIETDYAARLRKLTKSYQPKKKDDEENGYTSSKAFCLMLNEINDIAGQHELISENLTSSINKEVSTLIKELKDERKK
ncbi:hypothetical protein ISCGN_015633, partial [Ixodes scapularis]